MRWAAAAARRWPLLDPGVEARRFDQRSRHFGDHVPWADGVRLYSVLSPFGRHHARQQLYTALCCRVWPCGRTCNLFCQRAYVVHLTSTPALNYVPLLLASVPKG